MNRIALQLKLLLAPDGQEPVKVKVMLALLVTQNARYVSALTLFPLRLALRIAIVCLLATNPCGIPGDAQIAGATSSRAFY
jgi:hypothetical protein